jgi:bacillithiol synthase
MMPRCTKIPITRSGKIQKLVADYLNEAPELQALYSFKPRFDEFANVIQGKSAFPQENRDVLVNSLKQQYQEAGIDDRLVNQQIAALANPTTFTVTTGQQTGILLGPLYTTMKILSTVALTRELGSKFPQNQFVPVFWMATEDHDIEEINHVWVQNKKYEWNTQETGPAGRLKTDGILDLIQEIPELQSKSADSEWLVEILNRAYSKSNLSEATRVLVHELFGDLGLLVMDADRAELKKVFAPIIEKDILKQISFNESRKAIESLEKSYKVQVNGREINFFYLLDGYRERMVITENGFATQDKKYSWSREELISRIRNHPEEFSPNVMMRPVYQETILPNLAYFGGGAEVSYWLELKPVFDAHHVQYPMLLLRNSAMIIDAENTHRIENLQLKTEDLFSSLEELERNYVMQHSAEDLELKSNLIELESWLEKIQKISASIDQSMEDSAIAFGVRIKDQANRLSKKLIREAKRRERINGNRIGKLYDHMYPGGTLQERKESLIGIITQHGKSSISELMSNQEFLGKSFIVITY